VWINAREWRQKKELEKLPDKKEIYWCRSLIDAPAY